MIDDALLFSYQKNTLDLIDQTFNYKPRMSSAKVKSALNGFESLTIKLDVNELGARINELIEDVGKLGVVSVGDLQVYANAEGAPPKTIVEAMENGTLFFDAVYYFANDTGTDVTLMPKVDTGMTKDQLITTAKQRLLWTALFLMLRGSYPESVGNDVGRDVPAFLRNICGMNESPANVAQGLASFDLKKIEPVWIRGITWSTFAAAIKQRLGLGLAGYRMLGPFKLYPCRADAPDEAKEAYEWVRAIAVESLTMRSCRVRDPQP